MAKTSQGALTIGVKTAARLLGCSEANAYAAVRTGEIPTIRVGKRLLIPRAALAKMLGVEPEVLGVRSFTGRGQESESELEIGEPFDFTSNSDGEEERAGQ